MRKIIPILIIISTWLAGCRPSEVVALTIQDAWARPAAAGQNSAIYMTIVNPSGITERLRSASVSVARAAEIHQTSQDSGGVMSMHPQHSVAVPARGKAVFSPGGLHIMLVELNQDLTPGITFNLIMNFDHAGTISIPITVKDQ